MFPKYITYPSFKAYWTHKGLYHIGAQSEWHRGYLDQIVSVDKCNLPKVPAICLFFNLLLVFPQSESTDGDQ